MARPTKARIEELEVEVDRLKEQVQRERSKTKEHLSALTDKHDANTTAVHAENAHLREMLGVTNDEIDHVVRERDEAHAEADVFFEESVNLNAQVNHLQDMVLWAQDIAQTIVNYAGPSPEAGRRLAQLLIDAIEVIDTDASDFADPGFDLIEKALESPCGDPDCGCHGG